MSRLDGNSWTGAVIVVVIWIGGLLFLRSIMADADSLYPMRDADNVNPNYNSGVNDKVGVVMLVWSAACLIGPLVWSTRKQRRE